MKNRPLILDIIVLWFMGFAVWHMGIDWPEGLPFERWQWLIGMYVLNIIFIFGVYWAANENRNAPILAYGGVMVIAAFLATFYSDYPPYNLRTWRIEFIIAYTEKAYWLVNLVALFTIVYLIAIGLSKAWSWCVYKVTTSKMFPELKVLFYGAIAVTVFMFIWDKWDFITGEGWRTFSGRFFVSMVRTIFYLIIAGIVGWLLYKWFKPEYIPHETDPWLPKYYDATVNQGFQRVMHADLATDNIDTIITDIERELALAHQERKKAQEQLKKWQSVPVVDDATFYGDEGTKNHAYGRSAQYSRYELASIQQEFIDVIAVHDEKIKVLNERYNEIIKRAPKLRGLTKPREVKGIEGITATPYNQLRKNKPKQIAE